MYDDDDDDDDDDVYYNYYHVGVKYTGPIPRLKAPYGCWFWASTG